MSEKRFFPFFAYAQNPAAHPHRRSGAAVHLYWKQDVDTGIDFLHALQCSPGCRRHPGSVCRQIAVGHLSAVGAVYRFCPFGLVNGSGLRSATSGWWSAAPFLICWADTSVQEWWSSCSANIPSCASCKV